jgi:MOSC domain-containing protein YiiM
MDELRSGLKQAIDGRRGRFVRVIEAGDIVVGGPVRVEAMA